MRWFDALRLRVRALTRAGSVDADLRDEIQAHLQRLIEEHLAAGMSPGAARTAALREFGGVEQVMEASRDVRGVAWIANFAQDVKYGVRLLTRAPGFAAAAVLTVALGIGATTAMFSIVYGVVLRPMPFGDPDRLVQLWSKAPRFNLPRAYVGAANARDWREQNHVLADLGLVRTIGNFNLTGEGEPERLNGARLSANLLSILEVSPLLGRTFAAGEDEIGHELVVLLSHGLWQRRFGGDPTVVGRTISLNGQSHAVIGVMRPEFRYPGREFELWTPLTINPDDYKTRMNFGFIGVGRLKPGVTIGQARAELETIAAGLARQYPDTNQAIGVDVAPMLDDTVATVRKPLYVLLAAVAGLLLIGAANLANLLIARALVRRRELSLRAALGASRRRLMAQSIAELMPMLVAGGALGLFLAATTVRALVPTLPADMPRVEEIGMHLPVLLFTVVTLSVITVVIGAWPALEASRHGIGESMSEVSRGTTGAPQRARARDVLVVAQIAVTLLLLVGAALLMRSFTRLMQVRPGFEADRVLSLHLAIPRTKYPKDRDVAAFTGRVLERVRTLPEVVAAGMVNRLPLAGGTQIGSVEFEGVDPTAATELIVDWRTATPDYFRALQIPIVHGRGFTDADNDRSPSVGIIDERLAERFWPGQDPVGRRFRIPVPNLPWTTIVGVAGHIRHDRLDDDVRPQVYWNYLQRAQDRMALVVKTRGEPAALAQSIAAVVRSIDPEQPVYDVRTMDEVVDRSVAGRWLQTMLLGGFATVALLLASIGVYGVIAYSVGQRLREFGVRLALGARRRDLVAMVIRRGAWLFAVGGSIGLMAAGATARILSSLLYDVSSFDVLSFATSTVVLMTVGLLACYLPARRAGRVDPSIALRVE